MDLGAFAAVAGALAPALDVATASMAAFYSMYADYVTPAEVVKMYHDGNASETFFRRALRMLDRSSNVRRRKRHAELQRRRSRKDGERE